MSTVPPPIRVLIVDDHVIVRAGLRMLLESQPDLLVVGEAGTCADALTLTTREQPDIILLDLDLSGEMALASIPTLLAAAPQARILILTGAGSRTAPSGRPPRCAGPRLKRQSHRGAPPGDRQGPSR